jgi:hypothetical protein
VWSGYERSFSFPRDFEKKLNEVVNKELESNEPSKKPIILQGQTATGRQLHSALLLIESTKLENVLYFSSSKNISNPMLSTIYMNFLIGSVITIKDFLRLLWSGMECLKLMNIMKFYNFLMVEGIITLYW